MNEETLIELRSLGFSWVDIAHMLLVSPWTIHHRLPSLVSSTCHALVMSLMNNWITKYVHS